ncbi:hypothetical protein pb186bvf_005579 [Paramecium bursaria]
MKINYILSNQILSWIHNHVEIIIIEQQYQIMITPNEQTFKLSHIQIRKTPSMILRKFFSPKHTNPILLSQKLLDQSGNSTIITAREMEINHQYDKVRKINGPFKSCHFKQSK